MSLPPAKPLPVELRTWIDNPLTLRSGAAPAAAPFVSPDFPAPVRTLALQGGFIGPNMATFFASQPKPFAQTDWQKPILSVRGVETRTWIDRPEALLTAPPAALPFNQSDWQLPIPPKHPLSARTWISTSLSLLLAPKPFHQDDWPLPIPRRHPIGNRTWIDRPLPALTAPPPTRPFNQTDWPPPVPKRYPRSMFGFLYSTSPMALLGWVDIPDAPPSGWIDIIDAQQTGWSDEARPAPGWTTTTG